MNELIKYGNQMNSVPFKKFNKRDLNIFFAIVSRMRDKGNRSIQFSFHKLMKLSGLDYHGHHRLFLRDLKSTYHKMQNLTLYYSDKDKFISWVLFTRFEIDNRNRTCTVKVNPDLTGILNNLAKQFTRFSLSEFNRIDSSYAKNMFRLIKQYRTTGEVYLPMKKFRRLLVIPKSYTGGSIGRRVIEPILVELCPLVSHLRIRKEYGSYGRITAYIVKFTPEAHKQDDFNKSDGSLLTEPWMMHNIRENPYLSNKIKHQAILKIYNKPNFANKHKMPMKKFNANLKNNSLQHLKNWLKLRRYHEVYLTEYQVRKLKKTIKNRSKEV